MRKLIFTVFLALNACTMTLPVSVMGVRSEYIGCKDKGEMRYFHLHEAVIKVDPLNTEEATLSAGTYQASFGSKSAYCITVKESQLPKGFTEHHDHPEIEVKPVNDEAVVQTKSSSKQMPPQASSSHLHHDHDHQHAEKISHH